MYLYLEGEKVDLKILILVPFQYIRLLSWFQTSLNTWQMSAHCKHVLQVYITTKRCVQLPETADFSIRNYITKGNYKLNLVALKNVLSLVPPHAYYQNLVNLFLIKRMKVCKYRKKFIDVLVPLSLPHKYGAFLKGNVSFVPQLLEQPSVTEPVNWTLVFCRQPVSSETISIYGLRRGKGTGLEPSIYSPQESRVVGVFLEAETRHCKIKINCQGLFAIQIPISEEGRGCWERGVCPKSSEICSACLFPLGDLTMTHIFQVYVSGLFQKVLLWGHDSLLQKES